MIGNLALLNFGVPAAERDDDLLDCFVTSNTFESLNSGKKSIILGNRGSGKSALFRKLSTDEENKGNIVIQLSPDEYSYELLSETMEKEVDGSWAKQGAYSASWKYIIFITIMKELNKSGKAYKKGPEGRIYAYLRDNHAGLKLNPVGLMISYLKRMEGVKIGKYEASLKARELRKLYSLEEIQPLLDDLERICTRKKVIVLVDELDKGWDGSEDAVAFVAGLFNAAVSINNQLKNVKVYISLRKELYDNIPALYDDAQKVRDIIEIIEWDEERLLELIAKRIQRQFPELKKAEHSTIWNSVFSEVLDYRQTKSFNFIVDRTLYRPREIIQFCNDIIDTIKRQNTPQTSPLNYAQITEAEYAYSEARLKDICAEYRFQFPGLEAVLETFRGKSYNLPREALEEHLIGIILGEQRVSGAALEWCREIEPDSLIDILWSIGILRAQAVGGIRARRRSGSSYLGSHQISSLNLSGIQRFHIHPMFRSYLGLKESSK